MVTATPRAALTELHIIATISPDPTYTEAYIAHWPLHDLRVLWYGEVFHTSRGPVVGERNHTLTGRFVDDLFGDLSTPSGRL
jgi:hypothetical protein